MEVKDTWHEYTLRSTFHGLDRAFAREIRVSRRVAWMLLMTLSFCVLMYTLSSGVSKLIYPQYGTQITVQLGSSIDFPYVTFCPKNMFRKSFVEAHPEILAYLMAKDASIANALTGNETLIRLARNVSLPEVGSETLTRLLIEAAQPATETIYDWVVFNGDPLERKWFVPVMTSMGMCYRFTGSWTTLHAGQDTGLTVWSLVDYDEYFYNGRDLGAMGVKFLPHQPQDQPFLKGKGLVAGPQVATIVGLRRVVTTLQDNCVKPGTIMEGEVYTQNGCVNDCFLKLYTSFCGCKMFFQKGDYPLCMSPEEFDCLQSIERNASNTSYACRCLPRCVEETYSTQITWLPFPSPYYKSLVPRITNQSVVREWGKIASITIYFESVDTTLINETITYTSSDFFSDVGGLMGLWLGASVLTWAELFEVFWDMCSSSIKRRSQTSHAPPSTKDEATKTAF